MFGRSRLAIGVSAGLVIGFLALIVIVGTTIWLVERGNSLFEQSALQRTIRIAAVELRDHLRTAESSQRGFLLTGNQIYLAPYDTAKTRASKLVVRTEPRHIDRQSCRLEIFCNTFKIGPKEVRQHKAVMQCRPPSHQSPPVWLSPEHHNKRAEQKLLRKAHPFMRRHFK